MAFRLLLLVMLHVRPVTCVRQNIEVNVSNGGGCKTDDWPDVAKHCGGCKALVTGMKERSCNNYCRSLGLQCKSAEEEVSGSCKAESKHPCRDRDILSSGGGKTDDLLCTCEKMPPQCNVKKWSDVAKKCDECTALVTGMKHRSCTDYCRSQGLICAGAAEEVSGSCKVEKEYTCSDKKILSLSGGRTNDVLCKCKRCNTNKWEKVKKHCGDCTALVKGMKKRSCTDYCKSQGLKCAAAAEEVSGSCKIEKKHSCSDKNIQSLGGGRTDDVLCTCQ